jgi:hypothetical protein
MADYWTCPGCRNSVALTPTKALRAHPDGRTGEPCLGKGFRIDQPAYAQYVELFGREQGNAIMRAENPGWTPREDTDGPSDAWRTRLDVTEALEAAGWTGDDANPLELLRSGNGAVWALHNDACDSSLTGPGGWTVEFPGDTPDAVIVAACLAAAKTP